jgi:RNA polymerase sigma-70 factor, ECF subfamily
VSGRQPNAVAEARAPVARATEGLGDEELARRSQAGSLVAFEELVYRYERRVLGFVSSICENPTAARELTQDTFVKAFRALAQFDPRRSFGAWLFAIARRNCIDHFRAASRSTEAEMPELADHDDPASLLAARDERESLWQVAGRLLPAVQYQALWLKYAEEMDVAGIAEVLGKTQTHVKVLLFRARVTLGRELRRSRQGAQPGREDVPAFEPSEESSASLKRPAAARAPTGALRLTLSTRKGAV